MGEPTKGSEGNYELKKRAWTRLAQDDLGTSHHHNASSDLTSPGNLRGVARMVLSRAKSSLSGAVRSFAPEARVGRIGRAASSGRGDASSDKSRGARLAINGHVVGDSDPRFAHLYRSYGGP
jgi:hypothetical protein